MPSNILLLSIKPEYANKIFQGKKKVELRRVRTRLESGDLVVVYVTSPEKALVGSFEVERIITAEDLPKGLNNLWKQVKDHAGIKRKQFNDYYQGASVGVGIFLRNIQIFPNRLELDSLRKQLPDIRPPQSYRYLTPVEVNLVESIVQCKISEVDKVVELNSDTELAELQPEYTLSQCAEQTGFEEAELKQWVRAIERKKQAIFYGSPGTGKTFIAEKIAQHLTSNSDGFSELVQFHPAYSYEDFIQGIRPQSHNGQLTYPLVPGRFIEFCKKAESHRGLCVLIIDEINRANLSQVFGELMYLLEYRNKKIPLAGSNELFGIPNNVRIIGTMNTADRSIALIDHALRRRFAFIELRPNYQVLQRYHEKHNTDFQVDGLIEKVKQVNNAIADKHYELGISFFLTENLADEIEDIWQMEVVPYLEEYFFDQPSQVDDFRWEKVKSVIFV